MKGYSEMIEGTRLVRDVQSCSTTGDLKYAGTALEIADGTGKELFHVVVDAKGERQILVFPSADGYRIPVDLMERILAKAKDLVNIAEDDGA